MPLPFCQSWWQRTPHTRTTAWPNLTPTVCSRRPGATLKEQKVTIFVTGVPGAGKTLVGLNVATRKRDETKPTHDVFLSGNGPLVEVLREALTRDEIGRLRRQSDRTRKGVVKQKVKAFI